ncbi:hypothetical protein HBI56_102700 [Parastagonospora nodorum]|uniref:Aflatoxin regulatory protein domain-containing protein n=1 Tax=Phaeosphaeria nodorum (strain SN15 / ATCC MYA-4574 / FGSC 10173) TaxID=321614 RepID=A0A7U2I5K6_PHANO|nr:hypothetical protein HBH56_136160 [Parastagonospora nodorum]QRD02524.1 hypothetical protein JI435_112790 [Parastagonospora nodorum SN15]KAH3927064.1 hypothetical protein HBH54_157130 [Parastagonospora nodorum]KAH3949405.1 hypothetical protein HBH53_091320 [Parastagonospora nodorum]KAH3956522.1 hypothetical protein HBH51_240770 [Parastagonospora nodorum]
MSRRNGRPRSRRKGSTTSSAPISRQPSQGPQDIQRQILPPTPTSPVNKDCGELVPSPELVAPESSLGVSVQPLNTTTTANISNEKQHVKSHPDIRPEIHRQNLALEPYGGAAVDLTSASFPTLSFFDDPTNALQCDSSAFTFTPMFSPSQTRSDTDISQVFSFDYFGGGSESAWTELTTTTSSHTGDLPVDLNTSTIVCSCSTLLIHQLDRSASLMDNGQGDGRVSESSSYAFALQRSTVLLNHCFNVLCCTQCGPKPSSALLLCQAMDEVSVLLGMGTVWGEVPSGQLMCSTTNLAQDELLMRCGTYTVRRTDQRALLQTLMMKRFSEMQRAIYNLEKIVTKEDAASSLCHEVYAGMVTELKRKVASKVEHLKTLMQ